MNKKIPLFKVFMSEEAAEETKKTLLSGWIGQGQKVEEFESILKTYINYPYIVTLNNATAGLHLSLRLAGVNPGDEVISTPLTCFATNTPILGTYANIKWADINFNTCNIDIDDVINKITEKTKAIVIVHWGGIPVDIEDLQLKINNKLGYKIPIIEDCAHALGAKYKNGELFVGSSNNYCSFSFQAIKHLTTVDGGMLTTPKKDYSRAKLMRWYGIDREDKTVKKDFRSDLPVEEWGYKYHMNDVCATVGIHNFKYLENILNIHRDNANYYNKELSQINGISLFEIPEKSIPSYWLYTIKVKNKESFIKLMSDAGITVSKVHERNDNHPCVKNFKNNLPNLDLLEHEYLCIPVGWWVTNEDREYIISTIKKGW